MSEQPPLSYVEALLDVVDSARELAEQAGDEGAIKRVEQWFSVIAGLSDHIEDIRASRAFRSQRSRSESYLHPRRA